MSCHLIAAELIEFFYRVLLYFMASLDVQALFTNGPLLETINIITDATYSNGLEVMGLLKEEIKSLLKLTASE